MKIIFRLISAALFFIAAASCNLSEINNSDDPNNNGSGKKEYSITAKIIQTRVKYTDGAVLKQEWEIGDRLIGCYSSSDVETIEFSVGLINADGSANLKLESGTLPEDGTKIALLYDPYGDSDLSSGSLSVDLSSQDFDIDSQGTSVLPAFMSASAEYSEDEGATFVFQNDCAIIEVDGIYKTGKTSGSEINSVSSIIIENVIATGSYTFSEGKFSLSGNGTETEDVTVTCNRILDWGTGKLDKPVFLAVIPAEADDERTIDVTFSDGSTNCKVEEYGTTAFEAGKCYIIAPKKMVAKTIDNQYFTSVAAAFEHAAKISSEHQTDNTVTLVKERIYGLKEINDVPDEEDEITFPVADNKPTKIEIDYPVTLDLNGCRLDLDYYEIAGYYQGGFSVTSSSGAHFIVKDNVGGGMILSASYCPIIENAGTVEILSGYLEVWEEDDSPVIENHGTLKVLGGELFCAATSAIDSDGKLIIGNEGKSSTGEDEIVISCQSGEDGSYAPAISCTGGSVDIYDGKVCGFNSPAILLTGDVKGNIYGGYILNGNFETIKIIDGAGCTISGGVISNETDYYPAVWCKSTSTDDDPSTLVVKWPDGISNPSPNTIQEPIIYCAGSDGSAVPISAYDTNDNNTAKITINGGYLISHNEFSSKKITAFYLDDDWSDHLNLDLSKENGTFNFGGFYSNCSTVIMDPGHNIEVNTYDLYPKGKVITGDENNQPYIAYYQGVGSGFNISEIGESTGTLYKIDPGYPGTDQKPVEIGGVVWAPVNCGYDADHPYGLLYQWGRKYGQIYDDEPGELVLYDFWTEESGPLSIYPDTNISSKNKFYYSVGDTYWYAGTEPVSKYLWDKNGHEWEEISLENVEEYYPEKSDFDPCPDGWRIPSAYEFYILAGQRYDGADYKLIAPDDEHPTGGAVFYHQVAGLNQEELFLPAAGMRDDSGEAVDRSAAGYYWTSSVYEGVPWNLTFDNSYTDIINSFFVNGCSIRCVKE